MSALWSTGDPILCWLCPEPQGIASLGGDGFYECSRAHRILLADVQAKAVDSAYTEADVAWLRAQMNLGGGR